MNTGNGPLAAKRALEEFGFVLPPRTVMYITDSAAYTGLGSGTRRQGWAVEWLLQQDRIPAEEAEPCGQKVRRNRRVRSRPTGSRRDDP